GADRVALDAQSDHAAAAVDRLDRVGRDEPAAPLQEARLDRQRVRHVRGGAVHRALHPPDHPAAPIGHEIAGGAAELYDERAHELVLRATYGTSVEEMTRRPRMRPGEGITGTAASERTPIMIPEGAHLDPRFKQFPNLHEEMYESILAVPITAKERLA